MHETFEMDIEFTAFARMHKPNWWLVSFHENWPLLHQFNFEMFLLFYIFFLKKIHVRAFAHSVSHTHILFALLTAFVLSFAQLFILSMVMAQHAGCGTYGEVVNVDSTVYSPLATYLITRYWCKMWDIKFCTLFSIGKNCSRLWNMYWDGRFWDIYDNTNTP